MRKFNFFLFLFLFLILNVIRLSAQENLYNLKQVDRASIGLGFGLDFGGIGGNILFYPARSFGLFAGVGYALAGTGFNAGAKIRFISKKPDSKIDFYALGMYGYNAAIVVTNATQYNKLFYGPTFGLGLDFHLNPMKRNYWIIALLLPIRSSEVETYIDDLKANHGVAFKNELIPIGFSIGYRIVIN